MRDVASASYLMPAVALSLGLVEGLSGWGLSNLVRPQLAAAIILASALLLTGFHHSDGLADVGDALMARGDAARRIEVLKDRTLGIGAVGSLLLTYLVTWAALAEAVSVYEGVYLVAALVIAEVSARLCLLLVAIFSRPSHEGSGSIVISVLKGWRGAAATALSVAILASLAVLLPWAALLAACAAAASSLIIIAMASRWFGGAGGDILGASVEWGRMAALVGIAAALAI